MPQPIKKSGTYQKPRSKTVKKRSKPLDKRLPLKPKVKKKILFHPKYGTSKLEERFARDFLDKLGIEYEYQYEAKSIGRFFDFRVKPYGPIIEIDGQYWHGDERLYEEAELNAVQKKNKRIDEIKNKWCSMNGIPLIRISEYDINKDPEGVMNFLRKILKKYIKDDNKNNNTCY